MKRKKHSNKCKCPFCVEELKMRCIEPDFCQPCNIKLVQCKKCGYTVSKERKNCPDCGELLS